jgi:hypothetical protein
MREAFAEGIAGVVVDSARSISSRVLHIKGRKDGLPARTLSSSVRISPADGSHVETVGTASDIGRRLLVWQWGWNFGNILHPGFERWIHDVPSRKFRIFKVTGLDILILDCSGLEFCVVDITFMRYSIAPGVAGVVVDIAVDSQLN